MAAQVQSFGSPIFPLGGGPSDVFGYDQPFSNGAVGLDGAIWLMCNEYFSDDGPQIFPAALLRIDPNSGHAVPVFLLPPNASKAGGPMVAPDGSVYAEYMVAGNLTNTGYLLGVAPDGTTSSQLLSQNFSNGGPIVPDGQGGLFVSYWEGNEIEDYYAVKVWSTTSGNVYVPPQNLSPQIVDGQGTAYVNAGASVISYNAFLGQVNWSFPVPNGVCSMYAAQGGGVFVVDCYAGVLRIGLDGTGSTVGSDTSSALSNVAVSGSGSNYESVSTLEGFSEIVTPIVLDGAAPWPEAGGEPQQQRATNPTAQITVNFKGSKSPGDQLTFSGDGTCTQQLGLWYCPNLSWFWYVEIAATVSDDASKWKAKQHAVEKRSGNWKDSQGNLHAFSDSFNSSTQPDDDNPCTPSMPECNGLNSVQQTPGQKAIFWLDDPGSFYLYAAGEVIDSLQQNWEFTSKVCNRFGICTKVNWYEIIIVDSGSSLDFAESSAGLGPGPSPF